MKKKDLAVGESYAHKDSERPHLLMSMQLWEEVRTGFNHRITGYAPTRPGETMRSHPDSGLGRCGRVCLVAEAQEALRHIDLPEFLETPYDRANNHNASELFKEWKAQLPEGVSMELVNTAQLIGPYNSVMAERRAKDEHRKKLYDEARKIELEWAHRLAHLESEVRSRGQRLLGVGRTRVFPNEDNHTVRAHSVELSIEALEALLNISEDRQS